MLQLGYECPVGYNIIEQIDYNVININNQLINGGRF
jgi:hypothetical protein